jgi:hypothetical protein
VIARDRILQEIASDVGSKDYILSVWLEGSDGTDSLDEYSDIDLVFYTKEGYIDKAFSELNQCLDRLGNIDYAYEQPGRRSNNRYKVYHLEGTPDTLFIDVTVQSESFPVSFVKEDRSVVPVVLVDKASIVNYHNVDRESQRLQLQDQLVRAQAMYSQRSRAVKYTQRGLFLESLIYYQKYVLNPLVDALRVLHTPFQADCFLVHASRDFPAEVAANLENLYGVTTVTDIAERIDLADEMFRYAVREAQLMLSQSNEQT